MICKLAALVLLLAVIAIDARHHLHTAHKGARNPDAASSFCDTCPEYARVFLHDARTNNYDHEQIEDNLGHLCSAFSAEEMDRTCRRMVGFFAAPVFELIQEEGNHENTLCAMFGCRAH